MYYMTVSTVLVTEKLLQKVIDFYETSVWGKNQKSTANLNFIGEDFQY